MPAFIRSYVRFMDRIADYIGYVAMYLVFVMMGVFLFDVIMDKVFNLPQNWVLETAQFTLAAYYFMAGPKTLKDNDHVRMDLIYANLSERGKARIDAATIFVLMFYLVIMLIGALSSLQYSWETNQRLPSLWAPSLVPIKLLMVVCLVLMIMQAIALFFRDFARARGREI